MSRPIRPLNKVLCSLLTLLSADDILQSCHGQPEKVFHGWRRQTSTFIATLAHPEDVKIHVDGLLALIESKLKHFVSSWSGSLREKMQEIVWSAITLDCDLSQQSAYWYVCYLNTDQINRPGGAQFDDIWMKVPATHPPGQWVALMVSPALYKAGDSHGEHYEQWQVVSKSEVICFPPPLPPKLHKPPPAVPPVVDPKTARVREQHAQALQQGNETSKAWKFLGVIGIKALEYGTHG